MTTNLTNTTTVAPVDLSSTLASFSVSVKDGKVVSNIVEVKSAMAAKNQNCFPQNMLGREKNKCQ